MGRSPCCEKNGLKKGPWTTLEDMCLILYIQKHGEGGWRTLPKEAGLLRCGKSCRLRWFNYLRPNIKKGNMSEEEESLIIKLHSILGNRWSLIARKLPGRTDNEIKNHWNAHLKKRLFAMGIDPKTHKPFVNNDNNMFHNPNTHTLDMNTSNILGGNAMSTLFLLEQEKDHRESVMQTKKDDTSVITKMDDELFSIENMIDVTPNQDPLPKSAPNYKRTFITSIKDKGAELQEHSIVMIGNPSYKLNNIWDILQSDFILDQFDTLYASTGGAMIVTPFPSNVVDGVGFNDLWDVSI